MTQPFAVREFVVKPTQYSRVRRETYSGGKKVIPTANGPAIRGQKAAPRLGRIKKAAEPEPPPQQRGEAQVPRHAFLCLHKVLRVRRETY